MVRTEASPIVPLLFSPAVRGRGAGEVLELDADETRHVRALRLREGSAVRLTDGAGSLWGARLGRTRGRAVEAVLEGRLPPPPPLPVRLAFGVANKTHLLWLVEKATELGAEALVPLESERSRSVSDAGRSPSFWERARRRSVAALKQSGGAWLPRFESLRTVADYLEDAAGRQTGAGEGARRLVLLDGRGDPLSSELSTWQHGGLEMAVGPEGGFTGEERGTFREAGFRAASLGPRVLRFETAALAGLAVAAQRAALWTEAADGRPSAHAGGGEDGP